MDNINELRAHYAAQADAESFEPYAAARRPPLTADQARAQVRRGIWTAAVGCIATAVGYATAVPDGTYAIWWGAIVFGVWRALRGGTVLEQALAWEARDRIASDATLALPEGVAEALRKLEDEYADALRQGADRYVAKQSYERQAAALREYARRFGQP